MKSDSNKLAVDGEFDGAESVPYDENDESLMLRR
jgi:hypothetical protein